MVKPQRSRSRFARLTSTVKSFQSSSSVSASSGSSERLCVLAGFTRLLPVDDPANVELLPVVESDGISWLPATVVYGEGIFLQFNADRLREWAASPGVVERINELSRRYNRRRLERGLAERPIAPKYVLLHTFAHLLITQLAFDCGYGSASLRERIYCDIDDSSRPMEGMLIYTASGDSEGTLGDSCARASRIVCPR